MLKQQQVTRVRKKEKPRGFGSVIAKNLALVENNPDFYALMTPFFQQIYAVILPQTNWYMPRTIAMGLKYVDYGCVLVDGPGVDLEARLRGFIDNMELFRGNVPWFFDDAHEQPVRNGVNKIAAIRKCEVEWHDDSPKPWAVIRG